MCACHVGLNGGSLEIRISRAVGKLDPPAGALDLWLAPSLEEEVADDLVRFTLQATLQPGQAVQALHDRVKRINKINAEVAEWLQVHGPSPLVDECNKLRFGYRNDERSKINM